jgi:hypothetical protein
MNAPPPQAQHEDQDLGYEPAKPLSPNDPEYWDNPHELNDELKKLREADEAAANEFIEQAQNQPKDRTINRVTAAVPAQSQSDDLGY